LSEVVKNPALAWWPGPFSGPNALVARDLCDRGDRTRR